MPTTAAAPRLGAREWGLLLALSVLWGGSFFFNAVAVAELPPFTVVAARVMLAAAILWLVMRALGAPMPTDRRVWLAFAVLGLLNNVAPFSLIVWGQAHIASGVASILNATTPLFTVVAAHCLTSDEKMSANKLLGVVAGLLGVAAMLGGAALEAGGGSAWGPTAMLACLAGAASYALAGIYGRRFSRWGVAPIAVATGQVTASSFALLPLVALVDQPWMLAAPSWPAIGALVGVAALSTALAYILYFEILARAGATNLLLVTFLIPVSAILLGVAVLGERFTGAHLAGMGLIAAGLIAVDGRALRRSRAGGTRDPERRR